MHYDFEESGAPTLSLDPPPAPLQVQDSNGNNVSMEHVPSNQPIKYLGYLECIGSKTGALEKIKATADDYARVINCSALNGRKTHIFYRGIYKLSVEYVLPLTHFTFKELEQVQKKAHQAIVLKSGYNRHSSIAMLYGPSIWGGLEFFHLFDLQGYGQISTFMKHLSLIHI